MDGRKRNFSKALTSCNQFQSTPRNIINLFKMADRRFTFLSLILGLISNLIACFRANLALLFLQADYFRRWQNIITLLSPPVSQRIWTPPSPRGFGPPPPKNKRLISIVIAWAHMKGKIIVLSIESKRTLKNQCFQILELKFPSTLRNAAARALNNFY